MNESSAASHQPEKSIDWGAQGSKLPISKTHPFQISTVSAFSNPKKRKLAPVDPASQPPVLYSPPAKEGTLSDKLIRANYLMAAYLSLILNTFLIFLFIALVVKLVLAVKNDITVKSLNLLEENRFKIRECQRQYLVNKCHPSERVPALEDQCQEWEQCLTKDPLREELTKVVVRVASDTIEEFLNGISLRTVSITIIGLGILLKIFLSSHRAK